MTVGKKVAIKKDENNKFCVIIGLKPSFCIKIPTNKLFEKSGFGNINMPPVNPIIIEV